MHALDENFPIAEDAVGILQADCALPDGLDLRAGQLDAALICLLDKIVVSGFFIGGNLLCALLVNSHDSDHPFISVSYIITGL